MEATCSPAKLAAFQWITQHYAQRMALFINTTARTSKPISVIHVAKG
jgi:hypothetical protein